MKQCDIIIPIYNAYDCLVECVSSILKSTDLKENSLILINDKSSDKRINEYLEKVKNENKDKNIILLENEENLGFVKTVNKGMKYSKNDVLLLNSDTEVSKNWLNKIKKCAYSSEDVATVTPFSNNATLVSIPNLLTRNEIDGIDIEMYNEVLEKISTQKYIELPTCHGFCLFIKRTVLDKIGYFDEDAFERGYGEETDFSYRCLEYGYRHLLCDDTIVYHKESQSFKSERNKVIENHMKIIYDRYPEYSANTDYWLKNIPKKAHAKKIYYSLKLKNNLPNVLITIHNWETNTGGTTLHVRDLIKSLNDKYNFFILSKHPITDNYVLYSIIDGEENSIILNHIFKFSDYNFHNESYKELISKILEDFKIDILHVHHLQNHYFNVVEEAKKRGIKTIITLHDFYCLCPTINMLEMGDKFCIGKKDKRCSECLYKQKAIRNNIVENWEEKFEKILQKFDTIITPSENAKNYILEYYKDLDIKVIEHGIDMKKSDYRPNLNKNNYNVAIIGVICNHKGGNIFKELVKKANKQIHFHSFGYSEIKELSKNKSNYTYHGIYKRENLQNLLKENNIDLICFLQKWPETYSYTLNEAITAGIPVLSFDIGAGADRIKKNGFGWTVPTNISIDELDEKLANIFKNKEDYNLKLKMIDNYKIKTVAEMGKEYDVIYNGKKTIKEYTFNNIEHLLYNDYNNIEELEEILNSTKWKLINKIKFPKSFVYFVRKVLKRGE